MDYPWDYNIYDYEQQKCFQEGHSNDYVLYNNTFYSFPAGNYTFKVNNRKR